MKNSDLFRWRRVTPGHLQLLVEYLTGEPEVAAEIKKRRGKWLVVCWSWGSKLPAPVETRDDHLRFTSARAAKAHAITTILSNNERSKSPWRA